MTDQAARRTERTGYRLVLPDGWVRIPLLDGTQAAVDAVLAEQFDGLPTDRFGPLRSHLRATLLGQIDVARRNQGIDLYLPVARMYGARLAASFIVSYLPFDSASQPDPDDVLVAFAAQAGGETSFVDVDGSAALRTERVVRAGPRASDSHADHSSRRVDYVVAVPRRSDTFLVLSFSTPADGDPEGAVADLLVVLFDAVVATLTWVHEPVDTPTAGGR